ncbi:MAG: hypothetical protein AAF542_26030, partial [Pseudomonadota bacterium]
MKPLDNISKLILKIHEAAHEPSHWVSVLTAISDLGLGEPITIARVNLTSDEPGIVSAAGYPEEYFSLIETFENPSQEPGIQAMKSLREGIILTPPDALDEKLFETSNMFRNVYSTMKLYPYYIRRLFSHNDDAYYIAANHEEKNKKVSEKYQDFLMIVIDHIELSLKNSLNFNILSNNHVASLEVIHKLFVGVILFDRNSKVLFANHAAEKILERSDGLCIKRGKLEAMRQKETSELYRLLGKALSLSDGRPNF